MAGAASAALVNPDFKIGPDATLDSLSIAAATLDTRESPIQNYLVTWRDLSNGPAAPRVAGVIVNSTGTMSPIFAVSDAGGLPQAGQVQRARVASDGDGFLVVWSDTRPGGTGIRGALVSQQGAIINGADFLIAATVRLSDVDPTVVFTGKDYLIAWQDSPLSGSGTQIFFTRVTTAGLPAGTIQAMTPLPGHDASQQLEFLVKGAQDPLESLLVYQDLGSVPVGTYALRISENNSTIGPVSGTQMFTRDFTATGLGGPISGTFVNNEYLLLASKDTQIDCAVTRAWLKLDGRKALSSAPFALVGQGKAGLQEDNFPRAYYNSSFGEFLFLRNSKVSDIAFHIFMKRVSVTGVDRDPNMAIVDTADVGGLDGAVAASIAIRTAPTAALSSQYLVVWMDGRRRSADPAFRTNLYGAFIDTSQAGNEIRPYVRPVPYPSPLVGNPPLTVNFNAGTSTGIVDGANWDFGDGTSDDTSFVTHKYDKHITNPDKTVTYIPATYLAVYTLKKNGLNYNTFVRIFVGTGDPGGGGGPPQTVGGLLGPASPGVNTEAAFQNVTAALNFAKPNTDALRVIGVFDVSRLPVNPTGATVTFTLGTKTYSFVLLADGTYASTAGATPFVSFAVNITSGTFAMATSLDDLGTALAGTGVVNTTATKQLAPVPISISFSGLNTVQTIQAEYTGTQAKAGRFNFALGGIGATGDGLLRIVNGNALEKLTKGKTGDKIHDIAMVGNITLPGAAKLVIPDDPPGGVWRITVGNYSQDIPTSLVTLRNTSYSFKDSKTKSGIAQFLYNQANGSFYLALKGIPAEGIDASGMALTTNFTIRADLAVSFDLDLAGGGKFQASQFLRLRRKDVGKKKWTLR